MLLALLTVGIVAIAACGNGTELSTVISVTTAALTDAPAENACVGPMESGHQRIRCDGITFTVSVGEQCTTTQCGLIIDVHGWGASADFADSHTNMRELGTAAGYVVVQPNSPQRAWDYLKDDDVVFAFMERIVEAWSLDQDRVHMGGFSMGGDMTWRFVCAHSEFIASVAPAGSGAMPSSSIGEGLPEYTDESRDIGCDFAPGQIPTNEVDILYIHGTADFDIPFEAAIRQRDAVINGWSLEQSGIVTAGSDHDWTRWTNPQGTVLEFLRHDWTGGELGGHCYPGVTATIGCGADNAVDYGEAALQFYIRHTKNN